MKRIYVAFNKFVSIFLFGFFGGLFVSIYSFINKVATKFYEGKMTKDENVKNTSTRRGVGKM